MSSAVFTRERSKRGAAFGRTTTAALCDTAGQPFRLQYEGDSEWVGTGVGGRWGGCECGSLVVEIS